MCPPTAVDSPPSPSNTVPFCCLCFQPLFSGTSSFRFIRSFWLIEPLSLCNVSVFLDLKSTVSNIIYSLLLSFEWSNLDKLLIILIICRV